VVEFAVDTNVGSPAGSERRGPFAPVLRNRPTERHLLYWLAGVAALLLIGTVVSVVALHAALEEIRLISQSHETIARLRSANLALADVETGFRAFLLDGDARNLAIVPPAKASAWNHLKRARTLLESEGTQVAQVDSLKALAEARLSEIEQVVAERKRGPLSTGRMTDVISRGREELEQFHDLVGALLTANERNIGDRARAVGTAANARTAGLGAIAGLVLLMLWGGFTVVRRGLALRRAAEADLQAAKAATEAANRELEAFSYSIAHDLRSPLHVVIGFSEVLMDREAENLTPLARSHLQDIHATAMQMSGLIDALLAFSRAARAELHCTRVDVTALAAQELASLRQAEPRRYVETRVAPGVVVWGDPALLRIVLANLLGNAWKFTTKRSDARIEVELWTARGNLGFRVRDNGAGFDPAKADRLFVPFRRLHDAQSYPGTGIGLATVERIVRRHGGTIDAHGELGVGAQFTVLLPPAPA
jgi:signal transduction histidine kinase